MEIHLGSSGGMAKVVSLARKAATVVYPVMLTGEEGTPKREVAELIHSLSERKGPLVAINLRVIPEGLGVSSLFGHVRGAFTGAVAAGDGLLARADHGTLFLEEPEAGSSQVQSALLSLLQEKSFSPLGGRTPRAIDVRIISAPAVSNYLDLKTLQPELFYRLCILPIHIPPLRERRDDIPELAARFLGSLNAAPLSDEATAVLKNRSYPGNDREFYSILERAAVFASGQKIEPGDLQVFADSSQDPMTQEATAAIRRDLMVTRAQLAEADRSSIKATPIWEGRRFKREDDYCFVLMPFAEVCDLQSVYLNHVKKVVEERCALRCERADDITDISGVMQSVWESINRARLIIADMTERNPNVFYELGIAHTLGKPVIMITQSMDYVPFDLKHLRCIVYDYKPGSIARFEQILEKTIRRVLESTSESMSATLGLDSGS
jgi:hypothetical protein